MPGKILIIDDDPDIVESMRVVLESKGYKIDAAENGEKGLEKIRVDKPDLIILDVMLPGKDGISVCQELRKKKIDVPVLILTAKDTVRDKVLGLNSGADDYLTKPFAFEELLARIRVLLRRKEGVKTTILKVGDLELNQLAHQVTRAGKKIDLTSKEYTLLEYLMVNTDHIVTRTMISEHVWNESFDSFTNIIDVYINYLRSNIDKGFGKELIHTIRGTGYVLKG